MAKLAVHRPFEEGHLHDDLGADPVPPHARQANRSGEWWFRHLERVQKHHGQSSPQEAFVGSADEIAEKIGAYARVGIKGFIVTFAEPFDIETIERLATEVRPRLEQLVAA